MTRSPININWYGAARAWALALVCAATLASGPALAEPTAAERSLAAALFDQGRTLMSEGKLEEACAKLAESQRLDPGGGTLLNLALCHEKLGKIATAWTEFREARAIAKKDGRADREGAADAEIKKLEPQLSKISVVVPKEAKVPGLVIEIDGTPVPEAGWGTPFPVDPGARAIVAKAPGFQAWSSSVEINKPGTTFDLTVPKLDAGASTPALSASSTQLVSPSSSASIATPTTPSTGDKPAGSEGSSMRTVGFVVGSVGAALLGAGAITGAMAVSKSKESNDICASAVCADQSAVDLNRDALTFARVSTAAFGVGAAAAIAGVVLVVIAPKGAPAKVSVEAGPQSFCVKGRF